MDPKLLNHTPLSDHQYVKKIKLEEPTETETSVGEKASISEAVSIKSEPIECKTEIEVTEPEIVTVKPELVEEKVEIKPEESTSTEQPTTNKPKNDNFTRVFRIKVQLNRHKMHRTFDLPENATFRDLHRAIQLAMPWQSAYINYHIHKFEILNPRTRLQDSVEMSMEDVQLARREFMTEGKVLYERSALLSKYFQKPGNSAKYTYDFGAGWDHTVVFMGVRDREEGMEYPRFVSGKGKCPPEDCVGDWQDVDANCFNKDTAESKYHFESSGDEGPGETMEGDEEEEEEEEATDSD